MAVLLIAMFSIVAAYIFISINYKLTLFLKNILVGYLQFNANRITLEPLVARYRWCVDFDVK